MASANPPSVAVADQQVPGALDTAVTATPNDSLRLDPTPDPKLDAPRKVTESPKHAPINGLDGTTESTNLSAFQENQQLSTSGEAPPVEPVKNVSSGIQPTAPFAAENLSESAPPLATGFIPPQVEAPLSDVRDDTPPNPKLDQHESGIDVGITETTGEPNGFVGGDVKPAADVDAMELDQAPANPEFPESQTQETTQTTQSLSDRPIPSQEPTQITQLSSSDPDQFKDQEMADADAPQKVARQREDDEEEESARSPKRAKTDEGETMPTGVNGVEPPKAPSSASTASEVPVATNGTQFHEVSGDTQTYPRMPTGLTDAKTFEEKPFTEAQHKALLNLLRTSKKIKAATWFTKPVDPDALNIPQYRQYITKPMDLSTIEQKLKTKQYGSLNEFMQDFYQIVDNCICFNGPQHVASLAAKDLRNYMEDGLKKLPDDNATEPPPLQKKQPKRASTSGSVRIAPPRREAARAPPAGGQGSPPANATSPQTPQTYALQPDGMPLIRRQSTATDRPKREIHRPPPRDSIYSSKPRKKKFAQELKFCDTVVSEMFKGKHWAIAHPFLQPVDPIALNLPNYHSIIKKPMDFLTIKQDMEKGNIETAKQFHAQAKLVFENCYKFNPPGNPVYDAGQKLEEIFDKMWATKDKWMAEHAPVSEPASPVSDESEEEVSEDEPDDTAKQARLLEIQKQIAELNQEAQDLIWNKTNPKPTGKKAAKSGNKAAGSKSKKATSGTKEKAPKKKSKSVRLSYEDKQEISDTIQDLNDEEMRKAVGIIRNGCPQFRDVNDDELELEIEQIPEHVLAELLKYLRSVRPKARRTSNANAIQAHHGGQQDEDYEPNPRGKGGAATNPRKKNKPMSKAQQEASIQQIESQLNAFTGGNGPTSQSLGNAVADSSSDDESASESEEE